MVAFGCELHDAEARCARHLKPSAHFMDYDALKELIRNADDAFFERLERELLLVRASIEEMGRHGGGRETACECTLPCNSSWALVCAMSRTPHDARYNTEEGRLAQREFVRVNRTGFRKILKKWDKNHAAASSASAQQQQQQGGRAMSSRGSFAERHSGPQSGTYMLAVNAMLREPVSQLEEMMDLMQPPMNASAGPAVGNRGRKARFLAGFAAVAVLCVVVGFTCARALAAFVLGLFAAALLSTANGANDIANSMGTSVGAGVLTARQAVVWGSVFEFLGAITMGQFVAKEISKGVISAASYADVGQSDLFAFSMLCVVAAAGPTTLLATMYGFPISATHSIIGGLVAVGIAGRGSGSIGWGKLGEMCVGWVLSPLVGGGIAMLVYYTIRVSVLLQERPSERARLLQPVFLTLTIAVCVLFFLIKGPKAVKKVWQFAGLWLAVVLALGIGVAVSIAVTLFAKTGAAKRRGGEANAVEGRPSEGHAGTISPKQQDAADGSAAKPLKRGELGAQLMAKVPSATAHGDDGSSSSSATVASSAADDAGADVGGGALAAAAQPPSTANEEKDGSLESAPAPSLPRRAHIPSRTVTSAASRTSFAVCEPSQSVLNVRGDKVASVAADDEADAADEEAASAEETFKPLLVVSALSVAFAHGANDVGNAIGPLAVIYQVYNEGTIPANGIPDIPFWALVMGSLGFVLGIMTLGHRTISTVGTKITQLTPTRSFATQIGAAIAVLASSVMGLPVSTSHCLVGAVIGIGLAQKLSGVTAPLSWGVLKRIALSWVATIPIAMILALCFYYPFQHLYT